MSALRDISFTVLGGYLGVGKTTLLNRLLRDNQGVRIALLINDFGAINIDANLIEKQTDQQINLTNGCVCCGLSDGFDEALDSMLASDPKPDHIVVEASGVADVHSLAQYGKTPGLRLDAVLVVADATTVQQKARDKYVANTVTRQLRAADLLLLNKVDLLDEQRLTLVKSWLSELTEGAPVVETSFCELPQQLLLGQRPADAQPAKALTSGADDQDGPLDTVHHHEAYVTWNYASEAQLTRAQAEAMLAELPADLLRGKGFIATTEGRLEWHKVGKQERLSLAASQQAKTPATELVAIGLKDQLAIETLSATAERYLGRASRL